MLCIRMLLACVSVAALPASAASKQSSHPMGYEIENTRVVAIHSAVLNRDYELYLKLPKSYATQPKRIYPVLFVHDARYAFPLVSSLTRQLGNAERIEEVLIVGISYSKGDDPDLSRTRDYTPTNSPNERIGHSVAARRASGEAPAYLRFMRNEIFPLIAARFRGDMSRKTYAGHSFGGLFGAYVAISAPDTFENYILSDPSLWYDNEVIFRLAQEHHTAKGVSPNILLVSANPVEALNTPSGMVVNAKRFEALLKAQFDTNRVHWQIFDGEIHETVFPIAMSRGLLRFHAK